MISKFDFELLSGRAALSKFNALSCSIHTSASPKCTFCRILFNLKFLLHLPISQFLFIYLSCPTFSLSLFSQFLHSTTAAKYLLSHFNRRSNCYCCLKIFQLNMKKLSNCLSLSPFATGSSKNSRNHYYKTGDLWSFFVFDILTSSFSERPVW